MKLLSNTKLVTTVESATKLFTYKLREAFIPIGGEKVLITKWQHTHWWNSTDMVSAMVLAVLSSGGACDCDHIGSQYRSIWSYTQVREFIRLYRRFLYPFLPSLHQTPTYATVHNYVQKYVDKQVFFECFVGWTELVSEHYSFITPCTIEMAEAASKHSKEQRNSTIFPVYFWKYTNRDVEQIVDLVINTALGLSAAGRK